MKKNHSVNAFCLNALKLDYATTEKSFSWFRDLTADTAAVLYSHVKQM